MNEQDLRRQLLVYLTAGRSVRSPQWRQAVAVTGRHEFLRGGFFRQVPGSAPTAWEPVMPGDEGWLSGCYSDVSVVTQVAGTIVPGDIHGRILRQPTSSSTAPGLVVRMLEDLEVQDGMRVLEIGTGTGYCTALLCHRLGDDLVTSVEIDPVVAAGAATTLATLGHAPEMITGDGLAGHKDGAPYDRIIATCGVLTVPEQWIAQTRPGGQILATLSGWMHSTELARLTVHDDGTATGRLLGGQVSFMIARPHQPPPLGTLPDLDAGSARDTTIDAGILDDWAARFVAQIAAPAAQRLHLGDRGQLLVDTDAGSWALLQPGPHGWRVRQGGPERLWDAIEDHLQRWRHDGSPALDQFRITITPDGRHAYTWPHAR
ncbi:ATP-grasp peptide maturase system methyltransferase [Actinacidiphila glaucinigra]|uniref:ATP-grasp peptide maturase system methyltransferase n=1 Tax=Actinacidiphila glaucinigra TaxID=235986 RepID=UPI000B782590|nr:ATP-grasp peptide maturase system methyltransferase [Actinacidiphila glaucinigra]